MDRGKILSAKAYLQSVGEAKVEAKRCSMRMKDAWDACCQVTAQLELAPAGTGGRSDGVWTAYADLKDLLAKAYERSLRREKDMEVLLQRIPDAAQRAVLCLRYQQMMTWPQVQERLRDLGLYYEERQIFNIHDAAVRTVASVMENTQ